MADTVEKTQEEVVAANKEVTEDKPAPAAGEESAENDISKLERSIIHQVEYYFGDANLMRDKFLQAEIAKDDGWVPFSTLLTFKRLAALSTDVAVIVDALVKSDEGLLELSEDHTKVRRHPERPIPERSDEVRKEMSSRSVYVKGFPLDISMSELVEFFKQFEKVVHVNMRKYLDKATKSYKFKGSVFVTFENIEQAKKFVETEKVEYSKERQLLRKWQEKYFEEKQEERSKNKKKKDDKKQKKEEEKFELPVGSVLHFEGVGDDVTREILREAIEKVDSELEIAYVDFSKGEKQGHVRFHGEQSATKFLEKLTDKKLKLNDDVELPVRTLAEEEEKTYLANAVEQMRNRRSNANKNHHRKGGHHHGHHHGRKRRGGNDHEFSDKRKKSQE